MVTSWEQVSAKMMSKNAQNCSKLLEIAQILSLASARKQTCVLTVCQQQHWQVFEHCSNSRIKASVGTKSVPTLDMSVQTFERQPWLGRTDATGLHRLSRSLTVSSRCGTAAREKRACPWPLHTGARTYCPASPRRNRHASRDA